VDGGARPHLLERLFQLPFSGSPAISHPGGVASPARRWRAFSYRPVSRFLASGYRCVVLDVDGKLGPISRAVDLLFLIVICLKVGPAAPERRVRGFLASPSTPLRTVSWPHLKRRGGECLH
jgi:hypothetical protein